MLPADGQPLFEHTGDPAVKRARSRQGSPWAFPMVRLWVTNTDLKWFDFLAAQPGIDEINFWQPSGTQNFGAVQPGELFLFKLKAPRNVIGGFGVFTQASNLPMSLAWDAFGIKNGARSLSEMREIVGRYRKDEHARGDYTIGCRIVVEPVFFPPELWIPQPVSWSNSIVQGKTYSTADFEGLRLWECLQETLQSIEVTKDEETAGFAEEKQASFDKDNRYGEPMLVQPRLGQGAFRLAVTEAYRRQCAISGGKVLPALDAAHIQAFGSGGRHEVSNGLLLRKDIHSVFDAGYITFDNKLRLVVSDRVKTDFDNGNEYRRLHGSQLIVPTNINLKPDPASLSWHRDNVFLG